jgi:serine/threonine protein kinase/Flp pilus assembly protein TadD
MTDWNPKANELFLQARVIPGPEERRAFLDEACGTDAGLRQQVESLLAAGERAGDFLEKPAILDETSDRIADTPDTLDVGRVIGGRYKLLDQIGEGGMGLVFEADQESPVRRRVALKVVKPGMDTRHVLARFEAERQALALMDHPNIARVLDAGATDAGRPYFIMELVQGVPITEFCDRHSMPPRQRLELFRLVCQAVQHAHQKGIIHRDLKPSNVLVSGSEASPVVKVIDFGIAKAMGQALTDKTLVTGFAQMVGTPLYMSPEQAVPNGLNVDTRSDIYSLGVLLYELLTGTTPYDKKRLLSAGYDELRRIIREEEAPKPSTRLSTLGRAASTASENRRSDPRRLTRLLRGDLDWVVMKCLEKDRTRRYATADALAEDIQNYMRDRPVVAGPPSRAYRINKFVRRNWMALGVSAIVLGAVLAVAGTIGWAMRDAAARRADSDRAKVARDADALGQIVFQRGNWGEAIIAYSKALEMESVNPSPVMLRKLLRPRGEAHARLGHWQNAIADLRRIDVSPDDAMSQFILAASLLLSGDAKGYRRTCSESLVFFDPEKNPQSVYEIVCACGLAPDSVSDSIIPVQLMERCVAKEHHAYFLYALGLAHYRAGHFNEAITQLEKSKRTNPTWDRDTCLNGFVLAMAHHRLGHLDDARRFLNETKGWLDDSRRGRGPSYFPMHSLAWLSCLILTQEAEAMIDGSGT